MMFQKLFVAFRQIPRVWAARGCKRSLSTATVIWNPSSCCETDKRLQLH